MKNSVLHVEKKKEGRSNKETVKEGLRWEERRKRTKGKVKEKKRRRG